MIELKNLEVWKSSYELSLIIYKETALFPEIERFGLTSQMRRASVSITSNLSEGCGRFHIKDRIKFFHISRGSLFELESQILIAFGIGLFTESRKEEILIELERCRMLINGFIKYHKRKLKTK